MNGQIRHPRWRPASLPIPFVVNTSSFELLPDRAGARAPLGAIRAALRAWSISPVELYLENTDGTADLGSDDRNVITVAHSLESLDFVQGWAMRPRLWWNPNQGSISEADIVLNPAYAFATDGAPDARDIQSRLMNELAWTLGLENSPIAAASTFVSSYPGQTHMRSLEPDDIAGMNALYGGVDPRHGAIAGRVLVDRPDSTAPEEPVFGAHVVAADAAGVVQVGALTDWDGRFVLPSLPAGVYQVFVEPLDGPTVPDDLDEGHRDIRWDFRTLYGGGNRDPAAIKVAEGETTVLDPLRVDPEPPTLNPRFLDWSANGSSFENAVAQAVQIRPGSEAFLVVVGDGLTAVPRSGFSVSGSDIQVDPARIARGLTYTGIPYAILRITVRPEAVRGARSLQVSSGSERAALTGCIEVVAP